MLPKLLTPFPNRSITDEDSLVEHYLLDVPIAQREGEIQKDTVADDFGEEAVTAVQVGLFAYGRIIIPKTAPLSHPPLS